MERSVKVVAGGGGEARWPRPGKASKDRRWTILQRDNLGPLAIGQ